MPIRLLGLLIVLLELGAMVKLASADQTLSPSRRFKVVRDPPKGNINDFAQDERGFMWLAGNEGLGRFDGYRFDHFVPDGKPGSIADETVTSLQADGKGSLWVGTSKGLERLDVATLKFEQFRADPKNPSSLAGTVVTKLLRTRDGQIMVGTDIGLSALDPTSRVITNYTGSQTDDDFVVLSLLEDKQGTLWIGTDRGLATLDRKAGRVVTKSVEVVGGGAAPEAINALLEDSTGTLWVGTTEGLYILDPATPSLSPQYTPELRMITSLRATDSRIIIGTREAGVYVADRKKQQLIHHPPNPNRDDTIPAQYVNAMYIDRGNVLWVGFYSGGVVKSDLSNYGLEFYATHQALSFYEDPNGPLWVGHVGAQQEVGLRRLDPKTGRTEFFLAPEQGRQAAWMTAIVPDDEGWLWVATAESGLYRFHPTTKEVKHFTVANDEISVDGQFALAFDRTRRKLWIGTTGGGLDVYDLASGQFQHYRADGNSGSLSSQFVFALHQDRRDADVLWIGTADGGLNKLQMSSGLFTVYKAAAEGQDTAGKLSHNYVTSIHESDDGTLWLGTYGGGLNRFDRSTSTFRSFKSSDGLPTNVIFGVMGDKAGALWMTTNSGLAKFEPATGRTFTFTEADGLGKDDFIQGSYHQGRSGNLYVGGTRGFNIIEPTTLSPSTYVGPLQLTALRVYGKSRAIDPSGMSFSYRDGILTLDFAALSFTDSSRIKYRYRLVPLFESWLETPTPSITFTNLSKGDYTLEIMATNHHGVSAAEPFRMPMHVEPPPWRTWWAYVIYGAVLALLVGAVIWIQRRRIQALNRRNRLDAAERELELTGAVQMAFLPEVNQITTRRLDVFGYYQPANACGGDWWWHEQLDDGRHIVLVGDVTGHGAGPAMVTAAVATAFRVLIENGLTDIEQGLHQLNREVLRVGRSHYHMTMVAVVVDEATGTYRLHSAGAPPVLTLDRAGKHHVQFCPGTPLGTETGFELGFSEGTLGPTERLLLYTDGIPEISLPDGRQLGMRRFAQLYERTRPQTLELAARTILGHADESRGLSPQDDDWTFTLIEWRGDPAQRIAT